MIETLAVNTMHSTFGTCLTLTCNKLLAEDLSKNVDLLFMIDCFQIYDTPGDFHKIVIEECTSSNKMEKKGRHERKLK